MIARDLDRILYWADAHCPGLRATLRPGASLEQLRHLEATIGATLPDDVVTLYRCHDGQESALALGLIYGLTLMPLEAVEGSWRSWRSVADDDMEADCADVMTSLPPDTVALRYHHPGWIPITRDGSGNHLGIDLAPGPAGVHGQLIVFGRTENEKVQVSTSLGAFLHWYANELERGNATVVIDEDDDVDPVVEAFGIKAPANHFHDAARAIRRHGLLA